MTTRNFVDMTKQAESSSLYLQDKNLVEDIFQSREKKRAKQRVETFKSQDIKNWDKFTDNTARKSFVQELGKDPMTDPKLLMYADNMNRLKTGSKVQDISGDGGKSYQITKLRGSNRLGCTCNDWRYKRSVAQPGEEQDCKHIKQYRQMSKTAGAPYEEEGSFTHDGKRYSLQEAFRSARAKPTKQVPVDDLKWVLAYDRPDPARLAAADLTTPVLVAPDQQGRPTVIDGLHRLTKAVQEGQKTIPAKILPLEALKTAASDKAPRLTFITGGAGAGKSTMAQKLIDSGEFDVLIGTDTGRVVNGQYVKPSKAEREKIRKDREALALKMRAKGKRVLVEGFPRGVLSYPKLLEQADDVLYLDTPMLTRLFRVGKRSRERGTPMLPDLKMGLTTHFDDLKYRKEIEEKSPNFRPIRTYEDAKKEAMVLWGLDPQMSKTAVATREGAVKIATELKDVPWSKRRELVEKTLSDNLKDIPVDEITVKAQRGWGFLAPHAEIYAKKDGKNIFEDEYIFSSGSGSVSLRKDFFKPRWELEADSLYLTPEFQGKGIGSSLFKGTLRAAKDLGVDKITLQADEDGKAVWAKMPGVQFQAADQKAVGPAYARWRLHNEGPDVPVGSSPKEYPEQFLRSWGGSNGWFIGYEIPINKTAAAVSFKDTLPKPVIDGKPHDGTWTIVGSGRLSIPKKTSDIDYMVPLEEVKDLSSFQEYKDVPGVYWRDSETIDGRPSTIVAVPRYAYDKIDASYQQATDRFGKRKLRELKKTLPKDSFYKDIGVVYTSDAMKKEAAELISPLKPHQERVLKKLENSDGVIVAHRVGAGKTLTSIAAAVKSGKPIEVVTPASLTPNFEKELKKHVRGEVQARIRSYEKVTRESKDGKGIDPNRFLILDEAHRLRNSGTDTASAIRPVAAKAHKRLLLTGTAIYNQPADIAPLANIAAGSTVLPQDESAFNARFIRETEIKPGLFQQLRGVKPGIKKTLQNQSELENALSGRIDLHDEASIEDFPVQIDERIHVPMSKTQKEIYDTLMDAAPLHIRLKIKSGLPPSKQEARNLNAFVTGTRQASLSPRPYARGMTDEEEMQNTPKIQEAVRRLAQMRATDERFRGVVYSNYIDAGLRPYEKALERQKIPFETLTGSLSAKKKAELVNNYNSGKTPVLLVSSSGTEGLDLKGTKLVQVLEPHWNNSKIDQVIGRGVRYQSHKHLPEDERKVLVQRFYSSLPKSGIKKFLNLDPGKSTEEWVQDRADEKTQLATELREVFLRASGNEKKAGHVEDRIAERAPGAEAEVSAIRAKLDQIKLRKGQTYHVPLSRGKGYAVIGDVGGTHAVKTVLGPNMRPPGERLSAKLFLNRTEPISKIPLQKGDVIIMTPKNTVEKSTTRQMLSDIFKRVSVGLQGSHAHSGIYVGNGEIVEARIEDGVQKRPLVSALKNIKSAIIVRPKTDKNTRQGAADFATSRVGRPYDSLAFLSAQGSSLLIPEDMAKKLISRKKNPEDADKFICGNLVSASYAANGFSPKGNKYWDLTVPRDFLDPDTNKKVGIIGDTHSRNAVFGKFKGHAKISSVGEKVARAPRDYKREYAQYHAKPEQVENRSLRNQARRKLGLGKGDPREVDHKTPLAKGGGNGHANLRAVSRTTNRTKFTGNT